MILSLTAGATLHPLVLPADADAGPTALITDYAAVRNASILETTGRDDDALLAVNLLPVLRSTPDNERLQWYVERDGEMVGCVALAIPQDGDGAMSIGIIALRRKAWRSGIGSAVLGRVEDEARARGAKTMVARVEHHNDESDLAELPSPTGYGAVPADHAARFLQRHGFRLEQVTRASTFTWTSGDMERLERLRDDAAAHAAAYRIVQWMLPTPPAHADGYAWMKSRMSTDVPGAGLDIPEERWDAERVTRHDEQMLHGGRSLLVTAAQHRSTGELCAFNELMIGADHTKTTHQHDTLVLSEHRGHRLGMLVKVTGLLSWHDAHPDSPHILTYNAEENRPMLDINEAIGFSAFAYEGSWQKDLT